MVMEDGGSSLLDVVQKIFVQIRAGRIEVAEWQKAVKVVFKQMVECVQWLHSKNICHFDISLENMLIDGVRFQMQTNGKALILTKDIRVRLCDFGLAESFRSGICVSNKICGKSGYQSPEIAARSALFDAKKNDIWCLGVSVFMMSAGTGLYRAAKPGNYGFDSVINGKLSDLIEEWKLAYLFDSELVDILQ